MKKTWRVIKLWETKRKEVGGNNNILWHLRQQCNYTVYEAVSSLSYLPPVFLKLEEIADIMFTTHILYSMCDFSLIFFFNPIPIL